MNRAKTIVVMPLTEYTREIAKRDEHIAMLQDELKLSNDYNDDLAKANMNYFYEHQALYFQINSMKWWQKWKFIFTKWQYPFNTNQLTMDFTKIEEAQSSPKKEKKPFTVPSNEVLHEIVSDLYGTLPADVVASNPRIYITGSTALNKLGIMDRLVKDIDVVIVVPRAESIEETEVLKERIKEALLTLPEGEEVGYEAVPEVEAQTRCVLQGGYPVEIFVQWVGDHTLPLQVKGSDRPLHIATAESIFAKKFVFNKKKAKKDIRLVEEYLKSLEPVPEM